MEDGTLQRKKVTELREIAQSIDIDIRGLRKSELIEAIYAATQQGSSAAEANVSASSTTTPQGESDEDSQDVQEDDPQADSGAHRRGRRGRQEGSRSNDAAREDDDSDEDSQDDTDGSSRHRGNRNGNGSQHSNDDSERLSPAEARRQRREERARKRQEREAANENRNNGNGNGNGNDNQDYDDNRNGRGNNRRNGRGNQEEDVIEIEVEVRVGVLDILPEGYGFLRTTGYLPGPKDVYVSQSQVRKHELRKGDVVQGPIRPQRSSDKVPALDTVELVNGIHQESEEASQEREAFNNIPALIADEALPVGNEEIAIKRGERVIFDLPKSPGELVLLADMITRICAHNEDVHVMFITVEERPEDVTILSRSIPGEVIASTFDRSAEDHVQVAELALARAKCLVELGHDVVVVLRSFPRLAKSFSLSTQGVNRLVTTGIDPSFVHPMKRWFGQGRNLEDHGSLTIIGLIDSTSTLEIDQTIYQTIEEMANQIVTLVLDESGNYMVAE